jgi:hypothetical protein
MFGLKKANGYRSNNPYFNHDVKMQAKELYSKFYPTNEKSQTMNLYTNYIG